VIRRAAIRTVVIRRVVIPGARAAGALAQAQ